DASLTFFVVLSLLGAERVLAEGRLRDYLLAAGAAGLAAAVKYNGVLVLGALAAAHVVRDARTSSSPSRLISRLVMTPRFVVASLVSGLVFYSMNPFLLLKWRAAWGDTLHEGSLQWEWSYVHSWHYVDVGPAWEYHLLISLRYGVGVVLLGL